MKKIYGLILSLLVLTGCWDRKEVNDLAFVTMTGYDKMGENQYRTSIQVPLPGAMGGTGSTGGGGGTQGGPYYIDSEIGRNIRESNDLLQRRMSRKTNFSHRRVIIIGEELARSGFKKTLDVLLDQPQSRITAYVLVTRGEAMQILNAEPHLEKLPSEALRELSKENEGINVKNILNDIWRPGKDPVIPLIINNETENGKSKDKKKEAQLQGYAILKEDKLIFFTNSEETLGAQFLLNKKNHKNYTFPIDEEGELNVHFEKVKNKVSYKLVNERPVFTITFHVSASIMQNEPDLELNNQEIYDQVKKSLESSIQKQVLALLNHSKSEGIDVYGLGWYLFRHENKLWEKNLKENWRETLQKLEVKVKVRSKITRSINPGINIKE